MSRSKVIKIIGVIILLILFYILFINTDFPSLWHNLKTTSAKTIIVLIIFQIVTQILLCIQWNRITKKILGESNFNKVLYILSTGSVIESITPGAKVGGEVTRLFYIKQQFETTSSNAASIIAIQKSISMSVMFLVCLISFIYVSINLNIGLSFMSKILIYTLCVVLILFFIFFMFFSKLLIKLFENSSNKILIKIHKFIIVYNESIKLISKKEWFIQFVISMLVWLLFPFKMIILTYSLGVEVSFFFVIGVTMTSYLMASLPITPGGLGTFEGTMIALFALLNIDNALAASITVVFRIITFWLVMIFSTIYVIIYRRVCKNEKDNT